MPLPPLVGSLLARLRSLRSGRTGSATIYLAASVLARAGAFILIPLYTRRLTPADYGEYALAQTLVALLATPLTLGMLAAVSRFYFASNDLEISRAQSGSVTKWVVVVTTVGAFACTAAVLAAVPPGATGVAGRRELLCVVWAAAGTAVGQVPAYFARAARRPLIAAAFQLGEFVFSVGSGLIFVAMLDRGLLGAIEALAVAGAASGILGAVFAFFVLPGRLDPVILRGAFRFSIPFVPHAAGIQIQAISDRWVLKLTGQGEALGSYALASQLTSPISLVVVAWNEATTPALGELMRAEGLKGVASAMTRVRRSYLVAAVVPGVLTVAALPIALGWLDLAGPRFSSAAVFAPFICLSLAIESVYYSASNVVFYANRSSWIPPITVGSGALNVALNLLLIGRFGVAGALAARLLSMTVRSIAMELAARRCIVEASRASLLRGTDEA